MSLSSPALAAWTAPPLPADEASRVRLASRSSTAPATLLALADDPAATVRAAVALNPVAEAASDERLVRDADERIRALLAGKMARLLPALSPDERSAAQTHVYAMLRTLADDAALRVRVAIAEALTTATAAPRDLLLKMTRDPAAVVSDTVVRFSPLLTDADLLDLLATPPHPATAVAVASRAGLSAVVAADIVEHADNAAVTALLSNRTASIQEATLDSLIGRAGDHPEWHEPLACRPFLPVRTIRALSAIVAGHLLDLLACRENVPPSMADELRALVTTRLEAPLPPSEQELLKAVQLLQDDGKLHEEAFLLAAQAGEERRATAMLAVASGTSFATVQRAATLRSPKALVSLVARSGFSMRAGRVAQQLLGRLRSSELLLSPLDDDLFPLSPAEMDWQIELLAQPGR